jgi:hypothetical protein
MYQDVDMEILVQEWRKSKQFVDNYTIDFKDLDSITDGIPLSRDKNSPFVGDTTLPGYVRSIPRASIQQLPVFAVQVNGSKNNIPAIVSTFLLRRRVFNQDTFGKGLLSTLQIGGEQAISHGYAPFMCATGSMYDEFGTTMKLLHYSNVAPEPGIQDTNESGYFYVDADLTKSRVQKILAAALNNPNTTWDVDALKELLEMDPIGADYTKYQPVSRQTYSALKTGTNTYKFSTRYEVGKGGKFVTFCPQLTEKALRVIKNNSKFGYPRVQLLVIDPAPLTPFGTSRVRLASPNYNIMNVFYQNVASMLLLNSKPPLLKRGRFTGPVQLKSGTVWETVDQNASVELKELSNSTLEHFVPFAEYFVGQIQNIMGVPQSTTTSSKTAPGVKAQQATESLSTNQLTNIMENFVRQYGLVALDTLICDQSGEVQLILDDEAAEDINRIAPGTVGDDNKLTIVWEDFYNGINDWSVDIEMSMGKDEMDEKMRADLQDMLTTMLQNSATLTPEMAAKTNELMDMLMQKKVPQLSRINKLAPPVPTADTTKGAPAPKSPSESITFKDAATLGYTDAAGAMLEQAGLPSTKAVPATPPIMPATQKPIAPIPSPQIQ